MGTSKSCGVRVVKEKETFIGHCSKFISGQGWTVEIPKIDIEEKGYLKLKDGFVVTQIEEIYFNNIKYTPQTVNMSRNTFDVVLERKEKLTAKEIATKIKAKVDEISSCGLVEEYVTVFNKHINDIVEALDDKTEIEAVI